MRKWLRNLRLELKWQWVCFRNPKMFAYGPIDAHPDDYFEF